MSFEDRADLERLADYRPLGLFSLRDAPPHLVEEVQEEGDVEVDLLFFAGVGPREFTSASERICLLDHRHGLPAEHAEEIRSGIVFGVELLTQNRDHIVFIGGWTVEQFLEAESRVRRTPSAGFLISGS